MNPKIKSELIDKLLSKQLGDHDTIPEENILHDAPMPDKYFSNGHAIILNFIARSAIFNATKGTKVAIKEKDNAVRCFTHTLKNREYTAVGEPLNQGTFNIYIAIMEQLQSYQRGSVSILLKDLAKISGFHMSNFSKVEYRERFFYEAKKLENTYFIVKQDAKVIYFFRLIAPIRYNSKDKIFTFNFDNDLFDAYRSAEELMTVYSVKQFNEIKGDFTKCLYRYYLSFTDDSKDEYKKTIQYQNNLVKALGLENHPLKISNRHIKKAHDKLSDLGLISLRPSKTGTGNIRYSVEVLERKLRSVGSKA